jgi:hypothetical protein
MAGRPKKEVAEAKKVKPVKYDPNSDKPPVCFGNHQDSRICRTCWYAQECKKK